MVSAGRAPESVPQDARFLEPTLIERIFNRIFGLVVGLGFGPAYCYLLEVRGRKSGRLFSFPVNLLKVEGKAFLVAPGGRTQWVRNAEATGRITLKRGSSRREFALTSVPTVERAPILKAYLDTFRSVVQVYFPLPAGSPVEQFGGLASEYPVFELSPSVSP
jgi:deazaflavin-dependent oxidoreductase (nitroreductase family)